MTEDEVPLTAHDRCDAGDCGAQAYIRLSKGDLSLLFCKHHDLTHGTKAREWADTIRDESHRLMEVSS
jgi:hypothetical protein